MSQHRYPFSSRCMVFILSIILLFGSTFTLAQSSTPKNIILFIGDGMGVAHITAGFTVNGTLHLTRFKTMGLLTTHAIDEYITDSAASATAMATGTKTTNGTISVTPAGERLKTVLEYAEERGKSTGLVATCCITHATPACFAAHIDDRDKERQIAEQLVESAVDVLFGGGLAYFLPQTVQESKRRDDKNLIHRWETSHHVVQTQEAFRALEDVDKAVGLFALCDLPRVKNRLVSLADMTRKAIQLLSASDGGFFLMVEGSQIDWGGHDNDTEYIIQEMIDFDEAVGVGLDFAEKDDKTLILVTADHETGGFALEDGSVEDRIIRRADFTTASHTGEMVPLFSFGPGSALFGGIHDNTYIGKTMIELVTKTE